jgi:hypothetical protein
MPELGHNVKMPNTFKRGEHICALYDNPEEQLRVAAEYIADGLRSGYRALYVGESRAALSRFRRALVDLGVEVVPMESRRALVLTTHEDAHLSDGRFESERMLALLNKAVEDALDAGFQGLRACGDMSWLADEPPGVEQIIEYEALLNGFFEGVAAAGMCQYHRGRLAAHLLDHALATHSSVLVGGRHKPNPFYEQPSAAVARTADIGALHAKVAQLRK